MHSSSLQLSQMLRLTFNNNNNHNHKKFMSRMITKSFLRKYTKNVVMINSRYKKTAEKQSN